MREYVKYFVKRIGFSIFVLIGLSIVIFFISRVVPGDPARISLGPNATEEAVQQLRTKMHLDDPLLLQYVYWMEGAVQGDFGDSLMTKRSVIEDVREFLPASLELIFLAALIHIIFGMVLGVVSAKYNGKWPDTVIRIFSYVGIAAPPFVMAVLFLLIFGYWIPILPSIGGRLSPGITVPTVTGFVSVDSLISGNFHALSDNFVHLILPAIALALGNMFQEARITRSTMVDNSGKDYILMMRSQGVKNGLINRKYLFKPSVIPTISIMALDFSSMFCNAFLVETIFTYPGLSRYAINAMLRNDLNAVCAVVLILGIIFIIANIAVDIIVSILDPRISIGSGGN